MNVDLKTSAGVAALCAAGLVGGCDKAEPPSAASAPAARPVKTATVLAPSEQITSIYSGVVTANQSVTLSFEVGGRLVEYPVIDGQAMKEGDLIGRLDTRDQQNQVDAAKALVTAARAKLDRMRRAHEKNAVSEIEVIEQQAALDSAVARFNIANKALSDTALRAPYDGVVANTLTHNYAEVSPGTGVVLFQSDDVVELTITIPEQDVVHASESNLGEFVATFDSLPGRSFPLAFKEIETQGDAVTQTYRVGLTMPSPEDVYVLPGMTAQVSWSRSAPEAAPGVLVPASALFTIPNGDTHVWIINPDSMIVSKRHVRVGGFAENAMSSVLDGLEPGELVASAGVNHLEDGVTVRALDPQRVTARDE